MCLDTTAIFLILIIYYMYFDTSTVYGGVRLKPAFYYNCYILCILISAKSMVGLDSNRLLLQLLHAMHFEISKVYGGVRLNPVQSFTAYYVFL